jgi:hypothetical protein
VLDADGGPETLANAQAAGVVGFHISGLYSPLGWLSWEEIARSWDQRWATTPRSRP